LNYAVMQSASHEAGGSAAPRDAECFHSHARSRVRALLTGATRFIAITMRVAVVVVTVLTVQTFTRGGAVTG